MSDAFVKEVQCRFSRYYNGAGRRTNVRERSVSSSLPLSTSCSRIPTGSARSSAGTKTTAADYETVHPSPPLRSSLIKISPDDYCLNARNLTAQLLHGMRSALPYYMSSTAATQLPRDAAEFLDNILRTIHTAVMVTQPLPLRFRSFVTLQSQLSPEAKMTKAADTEWDQVTHNSDSVIRRIVGAIACTCIQCLVCRHTTTTADSKIILKLAPPAQRSGDTSVVPLRRLFEEQFFRHATYNYNYDLTVRCAKGCAGELDVHRTVHYNQLYLIVKIESPTPIPGLIVVSAYEANLGLNIPTDDESD
ncbi:hypothetical protein MTO96_012579 [Rhipicephalus appendiculatus]